MKSKKPTKLRCATKEEIEIIKSQKKERLWFNKEAMTNDIIIDFSLRLRDLDLIELADLYICCFGKRQYNKFSNEWFEKNPPSLVKPINHEKTV